MSGGKFCCLTFEETTRIVLIYPEKCKETILSAFNIDLQENEEISIKENSSQGIVQICDLYGLISSLNNPTEMLFVVESLYAAKYDKLFSKLCIFNFQDFKLN